MKYKAENEAKKDGCNEEPPEKKLKIDITDIKKEEADDDCMKKEGGPSTDCGWKTLVKS